ncbi:hypothetical protein BN2537_11273 [Streptomyces venezuelae]|nr:hypothetical protein BN2537_11273 [Streptomyces venezuelae]
MHGNSLRPGRRSGGRARSAAPPAALPFGNEWVTSPPPVALGCQCVWPMCRLCPASRHGDDVTSPLSAGKTRCGG